MPERTENFKRNLLLEELLLEVNSDLRCTEDRLVACQPESGLPLIFVVGALRSGTTLMQQWLANTGLVSCPTNLLSRFYAAPIIGAKIQLLLADPRYNYRNEIREFSETGGYRSENGKTFGALAPNEFWYFWRRFVDEEALVSSSDEDLLASVDIATLRREISGMMNVFGKPLSCKALMFNENLGFLRKVFPNSIFIYTQREPLANIESILDARRKQYGDIDCWYSFKIREYDRLKHLEPIRQVAGQVYYINKSVRAGLTAVPDSDTLCVDYENFCRNPKDFYHRLVRCLASKGVSAPAVYSGEREFRVSRSTSPPRTEVEAAYRSFVDDDHCRSQL